MESEDCTTVSGLGEILLYTDHVPTKREILEARKQRLRDLGYGK